jgi:hypothetical protein
VSALSDYLNAHIPAGWSKRDVIEAVRGDIDRTTVYRYLAGSHSPTPQEYVLQAFARALPGTSLVELREAAGFAAGEEEPWTLPPEAQRLNRTQRAAIETLIRAIVNAGDAGPMRAHEPASGEEAQQVRSYAAQLRKRGQGELAERLEASLDSTSSASATANRSSNT